MCLGELHFLCLCVQALSEGLRSNQTIAELNLSGCKITDEGVKVLASIIKVCSLDQHPFLLACTVGCSAQTGSYL